MYKIEEICPATVRRRLRPLRGRPRPETSGAREASVRNTSRHRPITAQDSRPEPSPTNHSAGLASRPRLGVVLFHFHGESLIFRSAFRTLSGDKGKVSGYNDSFMQELCLGLIWFMKHSFHLNVGSVFSVASAKCTDTKSTRFLGGRLPEKVNLGPTFVTQRTICECCVERELIKLNILSLVRQANVFSSWLNSVNAYKIWIFDPKT